MKTSVTSAAITKVQNSLSVSQDDLVAVEEPLEIRLGFGVAENRIQQNLVVTMRTPGHDFELAAGFLYTEGVIRGYRDVESIHYCDDGGRQDHKENVVRVELKEHVAFDIGILHRNFYTTSSCGVCGKASIDSIKTRCDVIADAGISIKSELIYALPAALSEHQSVFQHTGGLHAVALFDGAGKIVFVREDVGRHNAFDKVIGAALMKEMLPLSKFLALVSGRASFELVQKAVSAGIPVMAAIGAPSSLAINLAAEYNMTLIGFLKKDRFNIYAGAHRLAL